MVMSGPSRLLYHAVPCIVPAPAGDVLPLCLDQGPEAEAQDEDKTQSVSEEDWEVCSWYLQTSRVNVTVRQVLGSGQHFPSTHLSTDGFEKSEGETQKNKKRKSGYDRDT